MSGYTKLFSDIVDSSIWEETAETRIVWVTMLALADGDGLVRGSLGWLAGKSRVSPDQCQEAIKKFSLPDPRSRTPDNDGRRIECLEDGWLILNYLSFRDRLSNDPKACATRERVKKHRARYMALRNAKSVTPLVSASASVPVPESVQGSEPVPGTGPVPRPKPWHKPSLEEMKLQGAKIGLPDSEVSKCFDFYESNGWRVGSNPMKSWTAAMSNWKRNYDERRYDRRNGTQASRPNPRNDGIVIGPTDYGNAIPRYQRRVNAENEALASGASAEEAKLAGEVAFNANYPSPSSNSPRPTT